MDRREEMKEEDRMREEIREQYAYAHEQLSKEARAICHYKEIPGGIMAMVCLQLGVRLLCHEQEAIRRTSNSMWDHLNDIEERLNVLEKESGEEL